MRKTHGQKWSLPRENAESLGEIILWLSVLGAAQSHAGA